LRSYISQKLRRLGEFSEALYMLIVARPSMQGFNDWLFRLAIRSKGYNHCGSVRSTGEEIFIRLLAKYNPSFCVDIGANVGHYSEALLSLTNTNLLAFEPLPKAFEALRELGKKYPTRFQAVNKGVGNRTCELDLHYGAEDSELASFSNEIKQIDYVKDENRNVMRVPVVTLDSFFGEPRNAHLEHIDLIKIDTEGYEFEVLSGATETLSRLKPTFIQIEYNWHQLFKGQSLFNIASLLNDYVAYQLLPFGSGLSKVDVRLPQSNIYQYSNFVFVRSDVSAAL
jgi:FkbM family methyltransferase